jgi:transcriptional regulator with XRE-family HTH domain
MPEQTALFRNSKALEEEARKQEEVQRKWAARADSLHHEVRAAVKRLGAKNVAGDLGVDQSTLSNWQAAETGRGFPPPRLLIYLADADKDFGIALAAASDHLPPERKHDFTPEEELRRIKASLASNPDVEKLVMDRAFGPGVRP